MFSSQTCFLLPELSQIIVFGCVKLFRLHCFLVPPSIAACRLHCSFPLFSERPSINLSIKKSFVIQLSVSFLFLLFIRFSMIVFPNAGDCRSSLLRRTGGLKWTRTTEDNCLSLGHYKTAFASHRFRNAWWAQVDSNHRPRAYQARALTS